MIEASQHEKYSRKSQLRSSENKRYQIDELMELDVTLDNQLGLLAICDNGSEVYSVLNIDKSKTICVLTRHLDNTIYITTRDGQVFKLLQSSVKAESTMHSTIISSPSKVSARTSISTTSIKASQQCIWCDNFGHSYSTCQEFHEAILCGHIYLNKFNRIISTR